MPRRPSKNVVAKYVEFTPELVRQFEALAEQNGRSFKAELEDAMDRHLENPPTIVVTRTASPLKPAVIEQPAEPPPKRSGRKPKAG